MLSSSSGFNFENLTLVFKLHNILHQSGKIWQCNMTSMILNIVTGCYKNWLHSSSYSGGISSSHFVSLTLPRLGLTN